MSTEWEAPHVPMREQRTVAVIGLGSMGGAMASALLAAGWRVHGYDPAPEATAAAGDAGVRCADSMAELAGTPYVVLSLPSATVVARTVPVLLERPGTVAIVDTSTSEPAVSAEMSSLASSNDAAFVDAPVSGGRAGAARGALSAFVGGEASAVAAARPVLDVLTEGGASHRVGGPGSGNVVKLLNNVLAATNLIAVGEALNIAAAHGVDSGTAAQAISSASGGSTVSATMFPQWILSGTFDSGFTLGLMARDVDLALKVGADKGVNPSLLGETASAWRHALAQRGARADFTEAPATVTHAFDPDSEETT